MLTNRLRQCALSIAATAGCAARFGHSAATCFCTAVTTAGGSRSRNTLTMLSLVVQLFPFGPVRFDHVNHRLQFRIQLDQSLEREREGRERGDNVEVIHT